MKVIHSCFTNAVVQTTCPHLLSQQSSQRQILPKSTGSLPVNYASEDDSARCDGLYNSAVMWSDTSSDISLHQTHVVRTICLHQTHVLSLTASPLGDMLFQCVHIYCYSFRWSLSITNLHKNLNVCVDFRCHID